VRSGGASSVKARGTEARRRCQARGHRADRGGRGAHPVGQALADLDLNGLHVRDLVVLHVRRRPVGPRQRVACPCQARRGSRRSHRARPRRRSPPPCGRSQSAPLRAPRRSAWTSLTTRPARSPRVPAVCRPPAFTVAKLASVAVKRSARVRASSSAKEEVPQATRCSPWSSGCMISLRCTSSKRLGWITPPATSFLISVARRAVTQSMLPWALSASTRMPPSPTQTRSSPTRCSTTSAVASKRFGSEVLPGKRTEEPFGRRHPGGGQVVADERPVLAVPGTERGFDRLLRRDAPIHGRARLVAVDTADPQVDRDRAVLPPGRLRRLGGGLEDLGADERTRHVALATGGTEQLLWQV